MVFYRKYRPQKISELDNDEVRRRLWAILGAKELAHAFLFAGPKGLGKTSASRIVAKIVNCEGKGERGKGKGNPEPCNKCEQCLSITRGTNLDVLEIDAASNRGIDEIRELREKIKLAPFRARVKVYIIDEAHMLTREAFNALLKTLEEPPKNVVFILCTTEPQKLPETIISRCILINFTRAKSDEIVRSLSRIIKEEKIKIDKDGVLTIAKLSDGSFRDSAKILEQLVIIAGRKKITSELIEKEYKSEKKASELLELLLKKDMREAVKFVEEQALAGTDMQALNEQLLYSVHSLILSRIGIENTQLEVENDLSIDELKKLIMLLEQASIEFKTSPVPQLSLELAIIEYCGEIVLAGPAARQPHAFPTALTSAGPPPGAPRLASPAADSPRQNQLLEDLIAKIKPFNHSIAGVLRGCKVSSFDNGKLVLETKFKFHKEKLEEKKAKELVEKKVSDISGKLVKIDVVLKGGEEYV